MPYAFNERYVLEALAQAKGRRGYRDLMIGNQPSLPVLRPSICTKGGEG
jgi:hypothetical protein